MKVKLVSKSTHRTTESVNGRIGTFSVYILFGCRDRYRYVTITTFRSNATLKDINLMFPWSLLLGNENFLK